jgi:hypothetical protein
MLELLLGWVALLLALIAFASGQSGKGGALTLSYFVGLSLIHVPGAFVFVGSELDLAGREVTRIGFEMTVLGMAAFVAGAVFACWVNRQRAASNFHSSLTRARVFNELGWHAFAVGTLTYFVLIPLSFAVPSLTAVISAFATLLIIGLWLVLYGAAIVADTRRIIAVLIILPLLPLATLTTGGFLGYGIYWILSVVAFLFFIIRQRALFYVSAPLVIYFGLSLFVTYMGERTGIRDLVWHEHSTIVDRLDRVSTLATQFQFFDLNSRAHVTAIDDRLNQNYLVGIAVVRHDSGWSDFAYGATVPIWALIPRAIWPDKPTVGGGLDVVSDFTGIQFAEGTSVGAGQVLEFYINFGVPGLVIGFAFLGFVLMRLDQRITHALAADDIPGLVLPAMLGLTLLQPGGNLLEIIVAVTAAFLGAHLIMRLRFSDGHLARRQRKDGRLLSDSSARVRR